MRKIISNIGWQSLYAIIIVAILCLHLVGEIVPLRYADINNSYGLVLIIFAAGIYASRQGFSGSAENKVYIFWIFWALITRWLNGDFYLFLEFKLLVTMILGFLFFSVGTVLDAHGRARLLDVLSILYAGFFAIVALVGVCVFISNTYIHVPPENVWFTIRFDGSIFAPNFLSTSRLTSAPRFFMAWCLLLYQFVKSKKPFWRIILAVMMLILYTAIALCHSRTCQIAMSVSCAMLGMLFAFHMVKKENVLLKSGLGMVLACVGMIVCYKGFDISSQLVDKMHQNIAPVVEEYYIKAEINSEYFGIGKSAEELRIYDLESKANEAGLNQAKMPAANADVSEKAEHSISAVDGRKLRGNWSFSQRVEIWVSGFASLIKHPAIALKGTLSRDVAPTVNQTIKELFPYVKEYKINMHNAYLQVMMVTGVPGFLMILLWLALIVKKMLCVFFASSASTKLEIKILTLPIAGFMLVCMAESLMFTGIELSTIAFLIISGIFVGAYSDSAQEKKV